MSRRYTISTEADGDTLLVTADAFPEVSTFGMDEEDARARGLSAILEAISARMSRGAAIPPPATELAPHRLQVELPVLPYLKTALYVTALEKGVSRAELARRLGMHREQVDRLFRLNHRSRLEQIEAAAKALGLSVEVRLPDAAAA